jgi:2-polyprenyl-3-methyl-5-hydroxy-6-metoxy-1,4-benzoquinol methylase
MTTHAPAPELIFESLLAYQRTAALRAGIEVGLFAALGQGPADAATLAGRCAASERGIRILCDFLTTAGLVQKAGGMYSHTPTSAVFLDPTSPACMASTARFLGSPMLQEPFHHLADIVRKGTTVLPGQGSVEPNNPAWVEFAHSMAPMMAGMAGPLAALALERLRGPVSVLDIAAGHGLFGIEIARQNAEARITAIDWPAVLEVARGNARTAGVDERYTLKPGSAFDVEYGGPYDIALLTNFLHHFDVATCVSLLQRVRAALKPGGRVVALEFVPNDDRVSPPVAATFSMTMLATTPSGDAYTQKEFDSMYREAGFGDVRGHSVPTGPETVVIGIAR